LQAFAVSLFFTGQTLPTELRRTFGRNPSRSDTARDSSLDSADYPAVAAAFERGSRVLYAAALQEAQVGWHMGRAAACSGIWNGAGMRVTVHEVGDNSDLKSVYRERCEGTLLRYCRR
ncbi:hypothetical protein B0H14DRAFT_2619821, partial [Mycena olivaceomarginata]